MDRILERLIGFGVNLAIFVAVTVIGGLAMWGMWEFVAYARETWAYFPRGMFVIPAGITVVYVGVIVMLAVTCLKALIGKPANL